MKDLCFAMTGAYGLSGGIAGVNRNILEVLRRLTDDGVCSVTVLSYHEADDERPEWLARGGDFRAFRSHRARFALQVALLAVRSDLCVFDHVALALPALLPALVGAGKTVIFAHGSESWLSVRMTSRLSFRAAELCLANSHYTHSKMEEALGEFRGAACPLGLRPDVPLNESIPERDPASIALESVEGARERIGTRMLLLVGRMHPDEREKGHDELLAILPRLEERFPDVQLVFAGPGEDRERIGTLARRRNVARSVFLTGPVSEDRLAALYNACYAYVMPSRQEGFGLTYLEAMNWAKPCVGSRDDGAQDVIVDGETGILVENPTDETELLRVCTDLLANPPRAREMGKRGLERLHRHFTAKAFQDRFLAHLEPLLRA